MTTLTTSIAKGLSAYGNFKWQALCKTELGTFNKWFRTKKEAAYYVESRKKIFETDKYKRNV